MRLFIMKIFAVCSLSVALCGCGNAGEEMIASYRTTAASEETVAPISENEPTAPTTICVDVCGAVVSPGVYTMPANARVVDAIECAGGLLPEANAAAINQARPLADGEQVIVPAAGETQEDAAVQAGVSSDGKVNINTADVSTLCTLSGIGETKAGAIIAYREAKGSFASIEEIKAVDGIGEKLFAKIREEITTG